MRENHFRVWDKIKKEWFDTDKQSDYVLQNKESNLVYCDLEGVGFLNDGLALLDECGNYEYLDTDRFELTWFTGLKDKNVKEIFEGDVVNTWQRKGRGYINQHTEVVRYSDLLARFLPYNLCVKAEIIGNVYENPNLIKEVE